MHKIVIGEEESITLEEDMHMIVKEKSPVTLYLFSKENKSKLILDIEDSTKVVVYHYSIDSSNNIEINLNSKDCILEYYYSTINKNDNTYEIKVSHNESNTESYIYNHGVNLEENKLMFLVDGIVKKESSKCICNQENQIINIKNGKSMISPNLLIDNYDTISNHSAYIGKFKDEVLFYLMSRGISKKRAYELLLVGFLINKGKVDRGKIPLFCMEIEKI